MTVTEIGNEQYEGLSTDTKPVNVPANATFLETDTSNTYLYNGTSWVIAGIVNSINVSANGRYTTLADAIAAVKPNTATIINVDAGTFVTPSSKLINITQGNLAIIGQGKGITNIVADSSFTGSTPLLQAQGSVVGSSAPLTVNATPGQTQVTVSTGNSANFAAGQYILIRSNKLFDLELSTKTGEIQRITSVNTGTGVITLHDDLNDSYLTADSASIIQIAPLSNVTIQGITFNTQSASSSLTQGTIYGRFLQDFIMQECEIANPWWAGIELSSCLNSRLEDLYIHDAQDPSGPSGTTHYGVVIHAASKNIVVGRCQFSVTRHGYTMGGQTGTNFEGVPRNIVVSHCTSESADTAHFDTHQAGENITFNACTSIGGIPASGNPGVYGFQVRSPKTTLNDCLSLRATNRGIYLFGQASHTILNGCSVNNCTQFSAAGGYGVYLEASTVYGGGTTPAVTNVVINGCRFKDLDSYAVAGNTGNNDIQIVGCDIYNCNAVVTDANIWLDASNNCIVTGNRFNAGSNRPMFLHGTSDGWIITGNNFVGMGNTAPAFGTGTGSIVKDNKGYNPVSPTSALSNPFPTSGAGNITNSSQAAAVPASGTVQTVRFTPKTIVQTGGTVTVVAVNGVTVGTAAGNYVFKLGIGETYSVTYSVAPTISVFVE